MAAMYQCVGFAYRVLAVTADELTTQHASQWTDQGGRWNRHKPWEREQTNISICGTTVSMTDLL